MSVSAVIVEVEDLAKVYRSWSVTGRRRIEALAGVSLRAHAGEVFGLLGPNGAGKTTLIKSLLGVIRPSAGHASLFGRPAGSSAARQRVGYLPESLRIDPHHTARTALRFYGRLSRMSESEIRPRIDELLELVGLRDRDRESVRRFSKGMCQRLGLAQALMHDPDLLILDEPTDGLDPVGRNDVRKIIERLRDSGKTIFLNSHILQEVELVCTRVAIMSAGRLRGIGTVDELAAGKVGLPISGGSSDPGGAANADHSAPTRTAVGGISDEPAPPGLAAGVTIEVDVAPSTQAIDAGAIRDALAPCFARGGESISRDAEPLSGAAGSASDAAGSIRVDRIGESSRYRISCPDAGQPSVDTAVDTLRRFPLSILGLNTRRPSLEETFLRLVSDDSVSGESIGRDSIGRETVRGDSVRGEFVRGKTAGDEVGSGPPEGTP